METPMSHSVELLADLSAAASRQRPITLRAWFALYLAVLLAATAVLAARLPGEPVSLDAWAAFRDSVRLASPATKLLVFGVYMMISCTFLPLNTSWIVAAVAMEKYAVTGRLETTVLWVALVGATASTLANLNDYHVFVLLLRHHRVARLRQGRAYRRAIGWFERAPFLLLFLFNLLPIPLDVPRLLAASHRYSRLPFAAANFLGRFLRYAVIAGVTYRLSDRGYLAVLGLLGLAFVMALGRTLAGTWQRVFPSSRERNFSCSDEVAPPPAS